MTPSAPRSLALSIILIWLGFLAGWTVGSVPLTLVGAPFSMLWIAFLCGLCGIWLALRARGTMITLLFATPANAPSIYPPGRRALTVAALATVGVFTATAWFIPTGDARPLWAVSLLFSLAGLYVTRHTPFPRPSEWTPQQGPGLSALGLLALAIWLIYVVVLRHDGDDAFYLNLPLGLAHAPHGMLVWDTMYGAENWPVLGSNYRVEALQTLIAATSWASGLSVAIVAHFVLPTIWCVVWAATLALIGTAIFGRKWWMFALLAILSSFALAGSLQNWGVHGIARLFHGKAPLILIIIPLIYLLAHRADLTRMPLRRILPLLAGLVTIGVGLTANAIYIGPLALGLAVFAGWVSRGFREPRRLWMIAAATPALVAGLWLFVFDTPVSLPEGAVSSYRGLSLWSMFPDKLPLGLLALIITTASCLPLLVPGARFAAACLLGTLLFVLNPMLGALYNDYVTGGLNFRLWWAIPVPLFFASLVTGAVMRFPRGWLLPVVSAALLALSFSPLGLFGMHETRLSASFTKRPPGVFEMAQNIRALAEDRKVLASEEIAAWLPTIENHPPLVYVRRLYLDQSAPVVEPPEFEARRMLADWINTTGENATEDILRALRQQCPQVLIFPAGQKPNGFDELRTEIIAMPAGTAQDLQIFYIQPDCE